MTQSDRQLVKTVVGWAINDSDTPQSGYDVTLRYDTATNWSKTNTYGLSEKVTTKNKFKWPLVGETELSIEIAANQSGRPRTGALPPPLCRNPCGRRCRPAPRSR